MPARETGSGHTDRKRNPRRIPLGQKIPGQITETKRHVEQQNEQGIVVSDEMQVPIQAIRLCISQVTLPRYS